MGRLAGVRFFQRDRWVRLVKIKFPRKTGHLKGLGGLKNVDFRASLAGLDSIGALRDCKIGA